MRREDDDIFVQEYTFHNFTGNVIRRQKRKCSAVRSVEHAGVDEVRTNDSGVDAGVAWKCRKFEIGVFFFSSFRMCLFQFRCFSR